MFPSKERSKSSKYAPVPSQSDDENSTTSLEMRSSSDDDHSVPSLEASDDFSTQTSKSSQLPKIIFYLSLAVALLSAVNIAILPPTLSEYRAHPLPATKLEALPYGDFRLGLDRAAKMIPPPQSYRRSWPDRIARVSRKLKKAVWGHGVQVFITVEVSNSSSILPCPQTAI